VSDGAADTAARARDERNLVFEKHRKKRIKAAGYGGKKLYSSSRLVTLCLS
jgi:hypothetical protein